MYKKSNEYHALYKQKRTSVHVSPSNIRYNVNNNNIEEHIDNSIQLTQNGPYHALAQVLKNMTPDAYSTQSNQHNQGNQYNQGSQNGHEILLGVSQVYNGNCSTDNSLGFRSGGTTSNDTGTTPN